MVEIGGRGCNGVNVAYDELGLKPGGDIWPLTDVTSVWYVGSCSARKSDVSIISAEPGDNFPGGLSSCDDESSCESSCGCTITESASCCSFGAITFASPKWRWCYLWPHNSIVTITKNTKNKQQVTMHPEQMKFVCGSCAGWPTMIALLLNAMTPSSSSWSKSSSITDDDDPHPIKSWWLVRSCLITSSPISARCIIILDIMTCYSIGDSIKFTQTSTLSHSLVVFCFVYFFLAVLTETELIQNQIDKNQTNQNCLSICPHSTRTYTTFTSLIIFVCP